MPSRICCSFSSVPEDEVLPTVSALSTSLTGMRPLPSMVGMSFWADPRGQRRLVELLLQQGHLQADQGGQDQQKPTALKFLAEPPGAGDEPQGHLHEGLRTRACRAWLPVPSCCWRSSSWACRASAWRQRRPVAGRRFHHGQPARPWRQCARTGFFRLSKSSPCRRGLTLPDCRRWRRPCRNRCPGPDVHERQEKGAGRPCSAKEQVGQLADRGDGQGKGASSKSPQRP